MKAGTEVTVTWLPELDPTPASLETVIEVFTRQTGAPPTRVLKDPDLGIWGVMSTEASMLFKVPG